MRFKESVITITAAVPNQGKPADPCIDQYCEEGGPGPELRVPHHTDSCGAQVSVSSDTSHITL